MLLFFYRRALMFFSNIVSCLSLHVSGGSKKKLRFGYTAGIRSQEFDLGCVVLADPPVASVTMIIFFIVKET